MPFQTRMCVASFAGAGPCLVVHQLLWSPVSSRPSTDDDAPAAWCRHGEPPTSPPAFWHPDLPASSNRRRRRRASPQRRLAQRVDDGCPCRPRPVERHRRLVLPLARVAGPRPAAAAPSAASHLEQQQARPARHVDAGHALHLAELVGQQVDEVSMVIGDQGALVGRADIPLRAGCGRRGVPGQVGLWGCRRCSRSTGANDPATPLGVAHRHDRDAARPPRERRPAARSQQTAPGR
jgi:hypothetical protein